MFTYVVLFFAFIGSYILIAAPKSNQSFEEGAHLKIACGSNGLEYQVCQQGVERFTKETHVPVEIFTTPNDSNERYAIYQQHLLAHSKELDVLQVDVVWPPSLGMNLLPLDSYMQKNEMDDYIDTFVTAGIVDKKLVGIPWFADAGVLYYRTDLLTKYHFPKPPQTWEELEVQSKKIMNGEGPSIYGYVFQGKAYEGLTCNALEWLAESSTENPFITMNKTIPIVQPSNIQTLERIQSWIGTIAPKGVLTYTEEEARGVLQSGKAIFMRSWPYAWRLLQSNDSPVRGKIGMALVPSHVKNQPGHGTLGGWYLSVSKYSQYPRAAVALASFLSSKEEQKRRFLEGGFNPSRKSLYQDTELTKKDPELLVLKEALLHSIARPSVLFGQQYTKASSFIWNSMHKVLSKSINASQGLKELESSLQKIVHTERNVSSGK